MTVDLDARVRAVDFDRWASSRLIADSRLRADVVALYAFEAELMAIPTRVSQPLLAEMRYVWWRDQLPGVFSGEPRKGHPVLERLSATTCAHGLDVEPYERLIQAHIDRVHGRPHDLDALFVEPMEQTARILCDAPDLPAVRAAGLLWGLIQTGRVSEVAAQRREANLALRRLSPQAFPAVAHATLQHPQAPHALKQLRLVRAAFLGRV